jgi:hypothetical protein
MIVTLPADFNRAISERRMAGKIGRENSPEMLCRQQLAVAGRGTKCHYSGA